MHSLPPPLHFLPSLLKVAQVSLRDLISNRKVVWFAMTMQPGDERRFDTTDADTFLHRMGVRQRFIDWFWKTACMTIMNVPLERCSAGALIGFFRHLIGHSNYHICFPNVGLSELFAPQAALLIRT